MKYLLATLLFVSSFSFSQDKDAMVWTGLGLRAKLVKHLDIKYETQTRFYKNASTLAQYYNELGLKYAPVRGLAFSTVYRYSRKNQEGYFSGENRISLGTSYSYKLDPIPLRVKVRLKYQHSFDRMGIINETIYPSIKNMLRFKVNLKYKNNDFKRVQPFISYEIYHAINPKNSISPIDTYRFSAGIDLDLPFKNELSIYYMFENEYRSSIQQNHIFGIQYTYSLGKLVD